MTLNRLANKVLLIGWDAADWKVIHPLMDAGEMPNLQRLVDDGVMGNLATVYPILSPMLWTSIATGKRAYKHGIHGFTEPHPQIGRIRPITNLNRQTKAVWNILNQNGFRSNVVGWWPSHPAEPINGVMVSNGYQRARGSLDEPWPMRPGTIHPKRLEEPLKDLRIHPWELEAEQLLPFIANAREINQEKDKRLLSVAKIIADCTNIHSAATGIMQLESWDFMGVYYDAIDHFGHGFMKYHPPRQEWIPEEDFEMYKDVVNSGYRYHDMMLGTLLKLAGDETTVMLISDHGFHPDHLRPRHIGLEPAGPAIEHRPYGIFVLTGPGIKQDERVHGASLLDVAPTLLRLFGLPAGKDMDGKVLTAPFDEPPEVAFIESWDEVPGESGQHPAGLQLDPIEAQQSLDQLVALGYIAQPDRDASVAVAESVRELQYNLSQSYSDNNLHYEAASILEQLWDQWPDEHRFGVKLLDSQLAMGWAKSSRQTLDRLLDRKEKYSAEAAEQLEQLTSEFKHTAWEDIDANTQHLFRKLKATASLNVPAIAFLTASVLEIEKKLQAALERLAVADQVETIHLPSLYNKRGDICTKLRQWEDARSWFDKTLEIDPVDAHAHLGRSRCLLVRRKNESAAEAALASIGVRYHNPRGHYLHGIALHRCGHIDLAVKALEMAVRQNPVFPHAHRRLAFIHRRELGDPQSANYYLRQELQARDRIRKHRDGEFENTSDSSIECARSIEGIGSKPSQLTVSNDEVITVVSGLPRSGTSMMMQVLEAGGMTLLTDGERAADDGNPRGYFELERVKHLQTDRAWLGEVQGKVVKVIAQLVPYLSRDFQYRIIFMERDLNEILDSQAAMLDHIGRRGSRGTRQSLAQTYLRQLDQVTRLVTEHAAMDCLLVRYSAAIEQPKQVAKRLAEFFDGCRLDQWKMADSVDPSLYRHRHKGSKSVLN